MESKELTRVLRGFYVRGCRMSGEQPLSEELFAERIASIENIDTIYRKAELAGYTVGATKKRACLEKAIIDLGVNSGKPKVFTSYYANGKNIAKYGAVMVRIAQYAPRYCKRHAAYLDLAPNKDLLHGVKNGTYTSEDFDRGYEEQLKLLDADSVYESLLRLGGGKDVCIMCYEKPSDRCHRHQAAAWLNANGYEVKEFPYTGMV